MGRGKNTKRKLDVLSFSPVIRDHIVITQKYTKFHPNTTPLLALVDKFGEYRLEMAKTAASTGNLELLRWTTNDGTLFHEDGDIKLMDMAMEDGQVPTLTWLAEKGYTFSDFRGIREAGRNGHVGVFRWVKKYMGRTKPFAKSLCEDVVTFIEGWPHELDTNENRIKVLRWINRSGLCGCGGESCSARSRARLSEIPKE